MAGYNEILTGRFNRFLQKLLSMKGPASMNELGSVLTPSVSVFSGVENRYLESWNRFSIATSPTGGVGQQAGVRLRNPAGSNVLGVVEKMYVAATAATLTALIGLGAVGGNLTTVLTGQRLDARTIYGTGAIVPSSDTNTGGGLSPQIGLAQFLANTGADLIQYENQEIPLLPGDALQVTALGTAQQLLVWFEWRERALEDSEVR